MAGGPLKGTPTAVIAREAAMLLGMPYEEVMRVINCFLSCAEEELYRTGSVLFTGLFRIQVKSKLPNPNFYKHSRKADTPVVKRNIKLLAYKSVGFVERWKRKDLESEWEWKNTELSKTSTSITLKNEPQTGVLDAEVKSNGTEPS